MEKVQSITQRKYDGEPRNNRKAPNKDNTTWESGKRSNQNAPVVVICGATAVGKTKFAIQAALELGGEIISCDSMQLYQYMDIGSAKPTKEDQALVPHYLVDQIDPKEDFSVVQYQKLAKDAIFQVLQHGNLPIIAGGTGLYLNALLYDMDFLAPPRLDDYRDSLYRLAEEQGVMAVYHRLQQADAAAAERIHPNNLKKVIRALEAAESGTPVKDFAKDPVPTQDYRPILVGLCREREELYERINLRVDHLMKQGLLEEVQSLLAMGLGEEYISMKGIGYKELIGYLAGEYDLEEAVRLIKRNTRHLAKHQGTWFRRYDDMKWFNISDYDTEDNCIREMIQWISEQIQPNGTEA